MEDEVISRKAVSSLPKLGTAGGAARQQGFPMEKRIIAWADPLSGKLFRVAYSDDKAAVFIDGRSLAVWLLLGCHRRTERPVSPELMRFHRREQMQKLAAIFSAVLRFKKG